MFELSLDLLRPYLTVGLLLRNGIRPIVEHASYKSVWAVLRVDFNDEVYRQMLVRVEDVCNSRSRDKSPGHDMSDILHFQHYRVISTRQACRAGRVQCACCTKHTHQPSDAPKPIIAYVLVVKRMPCGARDSASGTKTWAYQIIPQYLCSECKALVDVAKERHSHLTSASRETLAPSHPSATIPILSLCPRCLRITARHPY